jgi:hypothetical protein
MIMYLMDEEAEQDFENHAQLTIDVLFALKVNVHYELDFEVEKQKQYQPKSNNLILVLQRIQFYLLSYP